MSTVVRLVARAALGVATFAAADPRAAEIEGVALPPTITYSGRQLELAGCGTREVMFFVDVYVISLYLPAPPADVDAIMAPGKAKLVRLNIVYDGSVPNELPEAWRSRLETEVSAEMTRTLQGFYTRVESGDVVTIGYVPGSGTEVRINGETVISKPGNTLIDAMLKIWIGENPISGNLKRLLLEAPCS